LTKTRLEIKNSTKPGGVERKELALGGTMQKEILRENELDLNGRNKKNEHNAGTTSQRGGKRPDRKNQGPELQETPKDRESLKTMHQITLKQQKSEECEARGGWGGGGGVSEIRGKRAGRG